MTNQNAMNTASSGAILTLDCERLDVVHAAAVKDLIRNAAQTASSDLHIDMRNVQFVDSTGLGALVVARKTIRPDRKVVLRNLAPNVQKILQLTKLDGVFTVQ